MATTCLEGLTLRHNPLPKTSLAKRFGNPYQFAMHEVSIMEEAVRMAVDAANEAGALRVLKLRLAIGTLSCVVPEALQFAFEAVSLNTPAADASLEMETVPAVKWCETCKIEFPVDNFYDPCPGCHDIKGPLHQGREIYIASIEVE